MFKLVLQHTLAFSLLVIWYLLSSALAAMLTVRFFSLPGAEPSVSLVQHMLVVAVLELLALIFLLRSFRLKRLHAFVLLVCFYHATKHALMLIEAYFYLNLWNQPPQMSVAEIIGLEVMGFIASVLVCSAVVLAYGASAAPENTKSENTKSESLRSEGITPAMRQTHSGLFNDFVESINVHVYLYGAVVYAACYLIAGALILIPLAGDHYVGSYQYLVVPIWMPLLQLLRGLVWVALICFCLSVQNNLSHQKRFANTWRSSVLLSLCLAIFGAAQLWIPNTIMPAELQRAHIIELVVSMAAFGGLTTWLWFRQTDNARLANNRLAS